MDSLGTSGHKTGESEFDEEYYEEFQQWKHMTQAETDLYLESINQEGEVRQFINNYEKYIHIRTQTDLQDRFYNPYNAIRDENKKLQEKEQTIKKLRDIQKVETE